MKTGAADDHVQDEQRPLLPRVTRADMVSRSAGVLARPLIRPSSVVAPIEGPLVCLVAAGQLATIENIGRLPVEAAFRQAVARLVVVAELNVGELGPNKVQTFTGANAADAAAVPELLRRVCHNLNASRVALALPRSDLGYACDLQDTMATLELMGLAQQQYDEAGSDGLCRDAIWVESDSAVGLVRFDAASPGDGSGAGEVLVARSLAECQLYLRLLGFSVPAHQMSMVDEGERVRLVCSASRSLYESALSFAFRISKADLAATCGEGPVRYGPDGSHSVIMDPGEYFGHADQVAREVRASPNGLTKDDALTAMRTIESAAACMTEVIRFIPDGTEDIPSAAFRSSESRLIYDRQPRRFSRARLQAIRNAYSSTASEYQAYAAERGWVW